MTTMRYMFRYCYDFNQNISSLKDMTTMRYMFHLLRIMISTRISRSGTHRNVPWSYEFTCLFLSGRKFGPPMWCYRNDGPISSTPSSPQTVLTPIKAKCSVELPSRLVSSQMQVRILSMCCVSVKMTVQIGT